MCSLEDLIIQSAQSLQLQLHPHSHSHSHSLSISHSIQSNHLYLNQLSSLSLDQLKQQPYQLQSISNSLQSELSLICFRQFKNLLISHQSSLSIQNSFNKLFHHLNQFIHTTHQLDLISQNLIINNPSNLESLSSTSHLHSILLDRNQIQLILHHLPSFESLLELPHLISTCIHHQQHSLWNQAIDLALKIHHLNRNLPLSSPAPSHPSHPFGFMQLLQLQVDRTLQSLRDHLLNRLSDSSLKLPLAVRTIATLRRLSSTFSSPHHLPPPIHHHHQHHHHLGISFHPIQEIELRMSFLISRWKALTENLNQLQLSSGLPFPTIHSPALSLPQLHDSFNLHSSQLNDDHFKFLRRWIELWRDFVGDALSIYTDIFLTVSSSSSASRLLPSTHHPHSSQYASKQCLNDPQTPLNYFLTQALNLLTSVLIDHLNLITSVSNLSSLLTQLAYCGAAFGKYGFDFTTTIFPLIIHRLEQLIKLRILSASQQLANDLRPILSPSPTAHSFKRSAGLQIRRTSFNPFSSKSSTFIGLENCMISADSIHQVLKLKPEQLQGSEAQTSMRHWLSFFPLLARLMNSQFTAMNELRLLPAVELYGAISEAQFESFKTVTEYLTKAASVLPACPPMNGSSNGWLQGLDFENEMSADQEKRPETRFRLVLYRLVLVWTRCVLPTLERSLRIGIYQDLSIESVESRFTDLLNQCEDLLSLIIPPPSKAEEKDEDSPHISKAPKLSDEVTEFINDQKSQVGQEAEAAPIDDQTKNSEEPREVDQTNSSQFDISKDLSNPDQTSRHEQDEACKNVSVPTTSVQLESECEDGGSENEGGRNEDVGSENENIDN